MLKTIENNLFDLLKFNYDKEKVISLLNYHKDDLMSTGFFDKVEIIEIPEVQNGPLGQFIVSLYPISPNHWQKYNDTMDGDKTVRQHKKDWFKENIIDQVLLMHRLSWTQEIDDFEE
jgi:hypothetical protein